MVHNSYSIFTLNVYYIYIHKKLSNLINFIHAIYTYNECKPKLICAHIYMHACVYKLEPICKYACMYACMFIYESIYIFMYACMKADLSMARLKRFR